MLPEHSIHIHSVRFVKMGIESLCIDSIDGIYGRRFRLSCSLATIDGSIWNRFRLENVSHKVVKLLGYKPYDLPEDLDSLRDILWGIMLYIRRYTSTKQLFMSFLAPEFNHFKDLNHRLFNDCLSFELISDLNYIIYPPASGLPLTEDNSRFDFSDTNSNKLNIHVGRPALKFNFA